MRDHAHNLAMDLQAQEFETRFDGDDGECDCNRQVYMFMCPSKTPRRPLL